MSRKIDSITFDPSKLTNFLNAQREADRRVAELRKEHPGKMFGTQRHAKDRIDIVRY